jgi:hypothetical protein
MNPCGLEIKMHRQSSFLQKCQKKTPKLPLPNPVLGVNPSKAMLTQIIVQTGIRQIDARGTLLRQTSFVNFSKYLLFFIHSDQNTFQLIS